MTWFLVIKVLENFKIFKKTFGIIYIPLNSPIVSVRFDEF